METYDLAAILEYKHEYLNTLSAPNSLSEIGLKDYKVIHSEQFVDDKNGKRIDIQAIAIENTETHDVYVHYFGTGDGNWEYNAAAYGAEPQPSEMQIWSLNFFETVVSENYEGKSMGDLYVSGHSMGGNNAQFVTMRSERYGDYVKQCVSLDGPGFSYQFVDDTKEMLGEAVYERRRDKIYGYYGENDFVSILGQTSIVPNKHIGFVEFTGKDGDFENYHMINGMLKFDENGNPIGLAYDPDRKPPLESSAFRNTVNDIVDKIKELPQDKQELIAKYVMMICEDQVGKGKKNEIIKSGMTAEEFAELKELLIPFLVEVLADKPEKLRFILEQFGMDPETIKSILDVIDHINTYSPEMRKYLLEGILSLVTYKDGSFEFDTSGLPKAIVEAGPEITDIIKKHPDDVGRIAVDILNIPGVKKAIIKWVSENPLKFAGVCIIAAIAAPLIIAAVKVLDIAICILQAIEWVGDMICKAVEAVITLFKAVGKALSAIKNWLREKFDAGAKYVRNNPYFRVDTEKLRNYATRIDKVNGRLRDLDSGLRDLYLQVGLEDLISILGVNLLTSESPTLNRVKWYLSNAAYNFEMAEIKAKQYMGGY